MGAAVLVLALLSGSRDLGVSLDNWDSYLAVAPGDPLPEFSARLDDGSSLRPQDFPGQVSLLTFWATWCGPCNREMPTLVALDADYGPELRVIGINRDSGELGARRAMVEAHMAERGVGFAQVYDDGQLARAFGVEQIPYLVLVDKQGEIRHLHLGQTSERTLRKEIDRLLDE